MHVHAVVEHGVDGGERHQAVLDNRRFSQKWALTD
jgi:hypothetical protein